MSTNLAYTSVMTDSAIRRPREDFDVVSHPRRVKIVTTRAQRRARPKLVYALGATAVVFAIFLAQLLITIALSSGAYTISDLQSAQQNLGQTTSALNEKLETLGSSQNLQANALALGMVNSAQPAFLRLSDGQILGNATAASAAASVAGGAATDSVPNSLLATIPLIKSTGAGHGDSNASVSSANSAESSKGASSASTSTTTPASTNSSNSGDLPSPVTN